MLEEVEEPQELKVQQDTQVHKEPWEVEGQQEPQERQDIQVHKVV